DLDDHEYESVFARCRRLNASSPADTVDLLRGSAFAAVGQLHLALQHLTRLITGPNVSARVRSAALAALAECQVECGYPEHALRAADQVLADYPGKRFLLTRIRALRVMVDAAFALGRDDDAAGAAAAAHAELLRNRWFASAETDGSSYRVVMG